MEKELKDLKKIISSLIISCPLSMTVFKLNQDYADQVGQQIPFRKFGYDNLDRFLRSIPDILELNGFGNHATIIVKVNNKSAHIDKLISHQKINAPKRSYQFRPRPSRRRTARYSNYSVEKLQSNFTEPYCETACSIKLNSFSSTPNYASVNKNSTEVNKYQRNSEFSNHKSSTSTGAIPKETNFLPSPLPVPNFLHSENEEIYISDSEDEYDQFKANLIPTDCKLITNTSNDVSFPIDQILECNVPKIVQHNLKTLIKKFDDGIWCSKLPNVYYNTYNKNLDYLEYGYKSLINMCMSLEHIFHCIRPDKGDFKLYDKDRPLPEDYNKNYKISELFKACKPLNQVFSSPLPAHINSCYEVQLSDNDLTGIINLYEEIPRQFLPKGIKENDYIDVCVGEIYDPSKFWVLLQESNNQLNNLMDEMQHFYKDCDNKYDIPLSKLTPGLYCVAEYNEEYHRALVVNVMKAVNDKVKVFYIDYGTTAAVKSNNLKYLHRQFSELPQQAIRARLASIYPTIENAQWSHETSSRLLSLVTNKVLVAHIFSINWERETLEIFLVDTWGEDDIYMNDTLVTEGLALFTNKEQLKIPLDSVPWIDYIHLYPTFLEIENGLVPNAAETMYLISTGMTLNQIYPRYYTKNNEEAFIQVFEQFEGVNKIINAETADQSAIDNTTTAEENWIELYDSQTKSCETNNSCTSPIITEPVCSDLTSNLDSTPLVKPPPGFENVVPSKINSQYGIPHMQHPTMDPTSQNPSLNYFSNPVNLLPYGLPNIINLTQNQITENNCQPSGEVFVHNLQNFNKGQTLQTQWGDFYKFQNQSNTCNLPFQPMMSQQLSTERKQLEQLLVEELLNRNLQLLQYLKQMIKETKHSLKLLSTEAMLSMLETSFTNVVDDFTHISRSFIFREILSSLLTQQLIYLAERTFLFSYNHMNNSGISEIDQITRCVANMSCSETVNTIKKFEEQHSAIANTKIDNFNTDTRNPSKHLVIETILFKIPIHIIRLNNTAYAIVNEIMQFTTTEQPIEKIRKLMVLKNPTHSIIDLPLQEHKELAVLLSRYPGFKDVSILHIIPVKFIPKMMECLGSKYNRMEYEDFLKKISINGDFWN